MSDSDVTGGQRLAGLVLTLNGGVVLAETGLLASQGADLSPGASAIDILLGLALLAGVGAVVPWVMIRVTLGAFLFCGMYVLQGDPVMAGVQYRLQ